MYFKQLLMLAVTLVICTTTVVGMKKDKYYCQQSSPCTCINTNNINIDLHDLNINLNLTNNVRLNYQPCPSDVNNISSIEMYITNSTTTNETTIPLAYYKDVKFEIGDAVMLVYENKTNKFEVILSCDPSVLEGHEYLIDFQNVITNHSMITLKTSKVCGLNLKDAVENSTSDSWTSFFSLLLFVSFIYFVGGSVVNACLYNEVGINMIPHHAFWSSLCNNIKEKLCGTSMIASTYESI